MARFWFVDLFDKVAQDYLGRVDSLLTDLQRMVTCSSFKPHKATAADLLHPLL